MWLPACSLPRPFWFGVLQMTFASNFKIKKGKRPSETVESQPLDGSAKGPNHVFDVLPVFKTVTIANPAKMTDHVDEHWQLVFGTPTQKTIATDRAGLLTDSCYIAYIQKFPYETGIWLHTDRSLFLNCVHAFEPSVAGTWTKWNDCMNYMKTHCTKSYYFWHRMSGD